MNELFFLPTDITEMSVAQMATLTPQQKAQVSHHLDQIADWLKNSRAKFEASLEHAYGERIRHARTDAGRDFGVVHIADGDVRVSVDQSKRVSWDQVQLATIAQRIAAAGERVEEFIDVAYSVSESRYLNWPSSLRAQFEGARTVKSGKPSYRLTPAGEV